MRRNPSPGRIRAEELGAHDHLGGFTLIWHSRTRKWKRKVLIEKNTEPCPRAGAHRSGEGAYGDPGVGGVGGGRGGGNGRVVGRPCGNGDDEGREITSPHHFTSSEEQK